MEIAKLNVLKRNNVRVTGKGPPLVFAHGFGCDQNMWRMIAPAFAEKYQIILFDHVGAGRSDLTSYSRTKYNSLQGYADDVLEIVDELNLAGAIFVGHSVSSMIGMLAAIKAPTKFSNLIMIGPSPCYIDSEGYVGGFSKQDIDGLLESLDSNYLGWSAAMAPVIMGNAETPSLGEELTNSFCRTNPEIAKHFARVTFMSDNRHDLHKLQTPTLILQCSDDVIAPVSVGEFLKSKIKNSTLIKMEAKGHCPNLSSPQETITAIKAYI